MTASASKDDRDEDEEALTVVALRNVIGSPPGLHAVMNYREDTGDLKLTGKVPFKRLPSPECVDSDNPCPVSQWSPLRL